MSSLPAKKVIASLLKKGFIASDSHHHYFEFWYNGQLVSRTYTSHSGGDIDDYLISAMRKQCCMDKAFFMEFVKCTKSEEDYIKVLADQKLIIL